MDFLFKLMESPLRRGHIQRNKIATTGIRYLKAFFTNGSGLHAIYKPSLTELQNLCRKRLRLANWLPQFLIPDPAYPRESDPVKQVVIVIIVPRLDIAHDLLYSPECIQKLTESIAHSQKDSVSDEP